MSRYRDLKATCRGCGGISRCSLRAGNAELPAGINPAIPRNHRRYGGESRQRLGAGAARGSPVVMVTAAFQSGVARGSPVTMAPGGLVLGRRAGSLVAMVTTGFQSGAEQGQPRCYGSGGPSMRTARDMAAPMASAGTGEGGGGAPGGNGNGRRCGNGSGTRSEGGTRAAPPFPLRAAAGAALSAGSPEPVPASGAATAREWRTGRDGPG